MTYTYTTQYSDTVILAPCLQVLCAEIAERFPNAVNLGEIGDVTHQGEGVQSDHNPFIVHNGVGYVRAIDVGGDASIQTALFNFINTLYGKRDLRVYPYGYTHKDNYITTWFGNGSTHYDAGDVGHVHISVTQLDGNNPSSIGWVPALDSREPWGLLTSEDGLSMADADSLHNDIVVLMHGGLPGPDGKTVVTHTANIDSISEDVETLKSNVAKIMTKLSVD